jgi:2-C-methyl-D-erythritol 2,4-cyclodiphosphate synthase
MLRIGWGYDIHRLHDGFPTVLGGVDFPDFPRGFDTHSDDDVVAHATIDALAIALSCSLCPLFRQKEQRRRDGGVRGAAGPGRAAGDGA